MSSQESLSSLLPDLSIEKENKRKKKDNKRKCSSKEISTDGINGNAKKTCKDLTQTDSSRDHRVITFQADVHRQENYIKSPILINKGNKRHNANINKRLAKLNNEDLPVPKQKADSDKDFFNLINQGHYNIEEMRSPVIPRRSSAGSIQDVPLVHDSSEENNTQEVLNVTTRSDVTVKSGAGLEAEENSVSGESSSSQGESSSLPDLIIEKMPKKHFDPEKLFKIIREFAKKPHEELKATRSDVIGLEVESGAGLQAGLQAEEALLEIEKDADSEAKKLESQASGVKSGKIQEKIKNSLPPPKSTASKRKSTSPKTSHNKRAKRESSELPKNPKQREFILRGLTGNFFLHIPILYVLQPMSSYFQDISIGDELLDTSLFGYADNIQSSHCKCCSCNKSRNDIGRNRKKK